MSYRIQVETSQPVWLSPTVDSALLKRPQDFTITLKAIACSGDTAGKPGDVPCVIMRGIANIVSEDEFRYAKLSYRDDTNWSCVWITDDKGAALKFSYSGGMPFEDTNDISEYKFTWQGFYTSVKQKQASITVEAHNITGFTDETENCKVQLAYPAYINSFAPNEYTDGIVERDTAGNRYIASAGSTFAFTWTIIADQTDEVVLKRNSKKIDYSDNNSYSETVSEDASFELTAKNGYPFPDIKTLTLQKTNWQKSSETIKDIDKILDAFSLPSVNRLMIWRKSYYLMVGKSLYTSTNLTAWTKLQDCPAGGASFLDCACGLYKGKIYVVAGGTGDPKYGINFNINDGIWSNTVGENIDIRYQFNSLVLSGYKSYYAGMNPGGGVFYDFDTRTSEVYDGGSMLHSNGNAIAYDACYWRGDTYIAFLLKDESSNCYVNLHTLSEKTDRPVFQVAARADAVYVLLAPVINRLFILTDGLMYAYDFQTDGDSGKIPMKDTTVDVYMPESIDKTRPIIGVDDNTVTLLLKDKNIWRYAIKNTRRNAL